MWGATNHGVGGVSVGAVRASEDVNGEGLTFEEFVEVVGGDSVVSWGEEVQLFDLDAGVLARDDVLGTRVGSGNAIVRFFVVFGDDMGRHGVMIRG